MPGMVMTLTEQAFQLADFHRAVVEVMHEGAEFAEAVLRKNLDTFTLIKLHHLRGAVFRF